MEQKRQNKVLPSGSVTAVPKDDGSIPPPSKQPTSAAAIFEKHSKSMKEVPPPTLDPPAVQKSATSLGGSHPLAAAFNESTQEYRNTLYENTAKRLDETLARLLARMHDFNATATASTPHGTSDPTGSFQSPTLFRRVGSYNVLMGSNEDGSEQTLEERLAAFAIEYKTRFEEINDLEKQWEGLVGEIWEVGVSCLGADTMLPLLAKSSPTSPSPAYRKGTKSTLDNSESMPVHKKVKFQEPEPELPGFLSASMHNIKPEHPEPVSAKDLKKLYDKIDALGTCQLEELVRIEKESKQSWAKKLREVLAVLKDE